MNNEVLRDASGVERPLYDPVPTLWPLPTHTAHRRAILARIRKRSATPLQRFVLSCLIQGLGLAAAISFVFFAWILYNSTGSIWKPLFPLAVAAAMGMKSLRSMCQFPDVGTSRIAQAMLDEGLCPSCGYEFGVTRTSEIVCSECGSRWATIMSRPNNAN